MIAKSWFSWHWQWKIGGCVALVGVLSVGVSGGVWAQIVPDNTLGAEGSVVTPDESIQGTPSDQIDGGAVRGANLFHSFDVFSIPTGGEAYFNNAANIQNILSRVTGGSISNIDGLLRANGSANLFLLNPQGIIFGPNARLSIGGSFVGSTASSINFADGTSFSATAPTTTPLLTISVPLGLQYGANPSRIQVQGDGQGIRATTDVIDTTTGGLRVQPNQTLALVGGDIALLGGTLKAAEGRIELGSVAGAGRVNLTPIDSGWALGYEGIPTFGDIQLSGAATVDAGGAGGGDIQVRGERLEVTQHSSVQANTLGTQNGGEVLVRTTEVDLSQGSWLSADVTDTGTGTGGDLTINTRRLLVSGGALVSASAFGEGKGVGEGKGGSLQITAADAIKVIGTSADAVEVIGASASGEVSSRLSTQSYGSGDAGDLTIDTGRLLVSGGALVSASAWGEGKGGSLQITAADAIKVIGTSADGYTFSALFTQSGRGSGDAGDLTIDTGRLLVSGGAQVSASAFGEGKGGSLQITAADAIKVIGSHRLDDIELPSALFARSGGSGDAGDLTIDTGRLLVSDGAVISSRGLEDGRASEIKITACKALQAENGTIRTDSIQSPGGAITIKAGNVRLFGNSDIRTGVASGVDNGGTITLTADSILAFDDSDILSFAQDGRGGDITLNTPAFFGQNYRPAPRNTDPATLDDNNRVDINAIGAVSGIITTPDVSLIQNSLSELPENQINTDSLLANSCIVRRNQPSRGSFTITGTGGLPQRPGDTQMSSFPTVDVETLPSNMTSSTTNPNRPWQKGDAIVEPQGLYRLPSGKLVLSRECS